MKRASKKAVEFPSPLGEMGLSIYRVVFKPLFAEMAAKFPSPLGEMGLSIYRELKASVDAADPVSVPSRGNGVIDLRR